MPPRPNIVFILTDDQGAWANGCYGNSEIRTPDIDRLAAGGVRFVERTYEPGSPEPRDVRLDLPPPGHSTLDARGLIP